MRLKTTFKKTFSFMKLSRSTNKIVRETVEKIGRKTNPNIRGFRKCLIKELFQDNTGTSGSGTGCFWNIPKKMEGQQKKSFQTFKVIQPKKTTKENGSFQNLMRF